MKTRYFIGITILIAFFSCNSENGKSSMNTEQIGHENLLFVGTYTRTEGHVDGQARGIYALKFDSDNGELSETEMKIDAINPSYISVDNKNNVIYAVNEIADGSASGGAFVKSYAFDAAQEKITETGSVSANGGAPCYIMHYQDHVFTANYVGGNFEVYSTKRDKSLRNNEQIIYNKGKGLSSRQEASHGHMITTNPHTGQVFTVDLGTDKVHIYDFDKSKSKLKIADSLIVEAGSGPRHIEFHKRFDILYVLNELSGTVEVFSKSNSEYKRVQTIHTTVNPNNQDAGCAAIKIHPDGNLLFVSNRGPFNSIIVYEVKTDGLLDIKSEKSSLGQVPRDFTIDPSGKFLLVANQNSNNIVVYKIDTAIGRLIETGLDFSAPTPVCLKF